ncbi:MULTISPECIES: hypothetical protein [Bartonella]|uniref:Uncharacterized protein n=1 Tax=Bartonella chomelii TaxID=236402 RepID=A0ABR6E4M9_9HYPH|nr:hypothetical protein [Bartonella schoenbuchensis]MBA9083511.1 hypothetical protein [Bartonella chomelii]
MIVKNGDDFDQEQTYLTIEAFQSPFDMPLIVMHNNIPFEKGLIE